jgi:hypothetical protein
MPARTHDHVGVDRHDEGGDEHRRQRDIWPDLSCLGEQSIPDDVEQRALIEPSTDHDLADRAHIVPIVRRAQPQRFFVNACDLEGEFRERSGGRR